MSKDYQASQNDANSAGMIGAIATWCECLQGAMPIRRALQSIAQSLGAEAIALTRAARGNERNSKSIFYDLHPTHTPLADSFAETILGKYFSSPQTGTIWYRSTVEEDMNPRLALFVRKRRLSETVIIPLNIDQNSIDFFELHFAYYPNSETHALLNMIGATLSQTWAKRSSGLFTDSVLGSQRSERRVEPNKYILSFENPFQLSRAEYRVCVLLSKGLSNNSLCESLNISLSTLRTHLRHIFEKTQTARQAELVYLLLTQKSIAAETPAAMYSA